MALCVTCGHARVSHGQDGNDCRTCPDYDKCDGYDSNVEVRDAVEPQQTTE